MKNEWQQLFRWLTAVVVLTVMIVLISVLVGCASAHALTVERLGIEARFAPPHNERVVGNQVTRYALEGDLRLRFHPHLWVEMNAVNYGVQKWRSIAANGPPAWDASDWAVSAWRPSWSGRVGIPIKWGFALVGEYGRCLWCSVPQGRYYGEAGIRWEPQLLNGRRLF